MHHECIGYNLQLGAGVGIEPMSSRTGNNKAYFLSHSATLLLNRHAPLESTIRTSEIKTLNIKTFIERKKKKDFTNETNNTKPD